MHSTPTGGMRKSFGRCCLKGATGIEEKHAHGSKTGLALGVGCMEMSQFVVYMYFFWLNGAQEDNKSVRSRSICG